MIFEIEFFRRTKAEPAGKTIERHQTDFASLKAAAEYGLINRPDAADGFRICCNDITKRTVSVRPGTHDV
jgi:hypothetical protein